MKFHVHFTDTGAVRHFWPGRQANLILELTTEDLDALARAPRPASGRVLFVAAHPDATDAELEGAFAEIDERPPEQVRRLVRAVGE